MKSKFGGPVELQILEIVDDIDPRRPRGAPDLGDFRAMISPKVSSKWIHFRLPLGKISKNEFKW